MNTQADYLSTVPGIPGTAPAASVAEVLVDIPSEYITGREPYSLRAYELTQFDMKLLFEGLRATVERDARGDLDGERYELDYKAYRIVAVHHYRCHEERGGDSYCGVYESYGVVDEDRLEVVRVFDEDGKDYPGYVAKLNDYANRHNLNL